MERIRSSEGTHSLESKSGEMSQETERIRPSEGGSHPRVGIGRDKSKYERNPTEQLLLTHWSRSREGQVRTQKIPPSEGTHRLETASRRISQSTERIRSIERHSRTADRIGRDKSRHGKNPTEKGALTCWRPNREDKSWHRKNPTERGALTT